MTTTPKPIIVVTGSTGAQGGAVLRALLADGKFAVRALTRDTKSTKAESLAKSGAEVVRGDLTDRKSLDDAFRGAFGVFIMSQFYETFSEEAEYQQIVNAVNAAKEAKVQHVVFSTLPGCYFASGYKTKVLHFDGKWRGALWLAASELSYTLVFASCYMDNWGTFMKPQPIQGQDGKTGFVIPMDGKRWAQIAIEDLGPIVAPIFRDPRRYNGKVIEAVGEFLTLTETVAVWNKVYGTEHVAVEPPHEVAAKFPFPGAAEFAAMWAWYQIVEDRRRLNPSNPYAELGIKASDLIITSRQSHPHIRTLETLLRERKAAEGSQS